MNGSARNFEPVKTGSYSEDFEKWAIIVGISTYKDKSLNLKFADRDAEELYKLLLSTVGGGFKEDHIRKLINEEATTAEITKALRSFVKKAGKDDIFMLYFACHGSPEMGRHKSNIMYLLTHDTDPNDISGTALRMDEIDRSLNDYLNAERVVIIADTCHSGAIGGGIGGNGRRSASCNSSQAINLYLQEVSKAKGGVALLTSTETNESSLEGEQWGGGHGVFTHFLLQGMRGDADGYRQSKDGFVTVGELFEYVCNKVREATDNKQHPLIGSNSFDRKLPIAFTIETNVQEHYKLGLRLYELGWILDDIYQFKAAAEQFRKVIHFSETIKTSHSEAELGLGKALAASGDHEEAIRVLSGLIERDGAKSPPEALLYLGIAQTKKRDYPAAESTFDKFLTFYPEDENSSWIKEYREWLNSNKICQNYALLIGINNYQSLPHLEGCLNDVMFMKKVLIQRCGFEEKNVFTMLDQEATYNGILSTFESLTQKISTSDTLVIYFSGHSINESHLKSGKNKNDQYPYLIVYDTTVISDVFVNYITPLELHARMNALPGVNKTLILDTKSSSRFNELTEKEGNYTLLVGTDFGLISSERSLEIEGKTVSMGMFTSILVQQLEEFDIELLTYGKLLENIIAKIRTLDSDQTPILIGDREQLVFHKDMYLKIFEFAQRRNYVSIAPDKVNRLCYYYRKSTDSQPAMMYYSFGRAFLEKHSYDAAIEVLQTSLQRSNEIYPETVLALGKAQVSSRRDSLALRTFYQYAAIAPEKVTMLTQQLIERTERLVSGRKYALLVGIEDYQNPSIASVHGAINDVQLLKEVLLANFGFLEKDIKILLNTDATRPAIIEAFKQLVEYAREETALFYFSGNGSFNTDSEPTIVSVDGRQEQVYDIDIGELTELAANNAPNLVTIVDAGWTHYNRTSKGSRTISSDIRERHAVRGISESREHDQNKFRLGFLSIYSFSSEDSGSEFKFKTSKNSSRGKYFGVLSRALIQNLTEVDTGSLTYSQWFNSVSKQLKSLSPTILGDQIDELIFDSRTLRNEVLELVSKIEQEPVFETISLLRRMIEQREQQGDTYPEGWLNLGVAYSAVGEFDKSIQALGHAIDLWDNHHEAHYQLGRVLFESEYDFSRAVSELKKATELDPENARAYYYLGQAIQEMIERDIWAEAKKALQTYLEKGAPLGHEDEVRKILESRLNRA